ncbi:hypothetical protein B0J18DRAFT_437108 [Chaetomium sp. MPI-SDFR-AT-0129]|nr:hypothetical protein B0J18DRAFT_437108 [Chaetomium sp. MPI-SDFR-AT-0129]
METLRALAELLKTHLTSDVVAAAAGAPGIAEDFRAIVQDIQDHAAARLLWMRPLTQNLTGRDINSAKIFLTRIYGDEEGGKKNWDEKTQYFKNLSWESLAVAAILCNADTLRHSTSTIRALCNDAKIISQWSPWPNDHRLRKVVQEYRQGGESSATDPSPSQPAMRELPILECSSCGTSLRLDPGPPNVSSPSKSDTVAIALRPMPEKEVPEDQTIGAGQKRRREETELGNASEETATTVRPGNTPLPGQSQEYPTLQGPAQRLATYRLADLLTFIEVQFPQKIEFIPEAITPGCIRFFSPRICGVQFQVTPIWLEAGGLPTGKAAYVLRRTLLHAIIEYIRTSGAQNPESSSITTVWWYGDNDGDGVVWPNWFGDLAVKWWLPGSLREFLARI